MNSVSVNRTQALIGATLFILVFAIAWHIWADWGLVTIHARGAPLGKVLASMQRQGHAKIETDISLDTPVTMDCDKAPLTDALETLSVVTESRWRLLYFAAGDKATLKGGELSWFGGQRPDGWKLVAFPTGNMFSPGGDDDAAPPDPRTDLWTPKTAAPAAVQTFFTDAAVLTNAGFAFPADWNPTVNKTPPAGMVNHVIPKLIKSAGGREDELFFLSKNARRGPRSGTADGAAGGAAGGGGFQFDPELLAAHAQAQIDRLPPDERPAAQSSLDTQRAFWQSLQGMSDDERRAAIQQHMQDPQVQQQMANNMDNRDSRMNHEQRMQHFQNYLNRKLTAMGKM